MIGSDKLVVRGAGAWTKHKLADVERYATAFARAMRSHWKTLAYVDLLAGPGRCVIGDTGEEIDGSPLRALKIVPAFDWFYFADKNPRNVAALTRRVALTSRKEVACEVGDCNRVVKSVVKRMTPGTLGLAFLDPEGMEVEFATLADLAARRVDVLYLFPSFIGLKRNVKQFLSAKSQTMHNFWGSDDWTKLVAAKKAAGAPANPETVVKTWVEAFRARAASIGLKSGTATPVVTNDRGRPMYHLLFFSKHEAGLTIWNKVMRIGATGQRSLPL